VAEKIPNVAVKFGHEFEAFTEEPDGFFERKAPGSPELTCAAPGWSFRLQHWSTPEASFAC